MVKVTRMVLGASHKWKHTQYEKRQKPHKSHFKHSFRCYYMTTKCQWKTFGEPWNFSQKTLGVRRVTTRQPHISAAKGTSMIRCGSQYGTSSQQLISLKNNVPVQLCKILR
jgi:hypothetical protein